MEHVCVCAHMFVIVMPTMSMIVKVASVCLHQSFVSVKLSLLLNMSLDYVGGEL
jgi:hypothetical protein